MADDTPPHNISGVHLDHLQFADETHGVPFGSAAGNDHAGAPCYPSPAYPSRPRHNSLSMPALPPIGDDAPIVPSSVMIMDSVVQPPASHLPPIGEDSAPVRGGLAVASAQHTPLHSSHHSLTHPSTHVHTTPSHGSTMLHAAGETSHEKPTVSSSSLTSGSAAAADTPMQDASKCGMSTSHHTHADHGLASHTDNSSNTPARQAMHLTESALYDTTTPVVGNLALARRRRSSLQSPSQEAAVAALAASEVTSSSVA